MRSNGLLTVHLGRTNAEPSTCALAACVLVALAWSGVAHANGYGEAKGLIEQAEAKLAAGDEAAGLALVDQAIKVQTTVDDKPKEYGYAAYAHLMLAKHYFKKGNKKRAQQEAKRAMGIHLSQEWVEAAYVVSPYDAFISQSFPALAGVKPVKLANRTIPNAVTIIKRGDTVYIYGFSSLARLDRKGHTSLTLYRQPGKPFYRFDASTDGNRLLVVYEEDENIQYVQMSPYKLMRLGRRGLPDDVFFEPGGQAAIVIDGDIEKGYGVWRLPLAEGAAMTDVARIPGRRLATSATRIIYSRYVGNTFGYVSGIGYNYPADAIIARDLKTSQERTLYSYATPESESFVTAEELEEGRTLLFVSDKAAGKQLLLLDDPKAGRLLTREIDFGPTKLDFERVVAAPSGRTVAVVASKPEGVTVTRYDLDSQAQSTARMPPSCTGAAVGAARSLLRAGLEADGRLWAHLGDDFFLIDTHGKVTCTDLKQFTKERKPEWAGADFAFAAPDEVYIGIEKGGGRFFIWVSFDELLAKAAH